jgi:hypothetical protein
MRGQIVIQEAKERYFNRYGRITPTNKEKFRVGG